jgi:hypothetical protein
VPNALQTLAGEAGGASTSDVLNVTASATYVASGVLFILGPLFTGPVNAVLPPTILGAAAPALGAAGAAALMSDTTPIAPSVGRAGVLAGLARAGSVGGLSVPQAWGGVTGEMPRAAMAIPAPNPGRIPRSRGGSAGSWGRDSAGESDGRGGGAAVMPLPAEPAAPSAMERPYPAAPPHPTRPNAPDTAPASVIPQAAREADVGGRLPGQASMRDQGGEAWSTETLRDEIDDLRKQLTDLAMERDVLMRSLALWARESLEE